MKEQFYKELLKKSPYGYAYHRILLDKNDNPEDYIFLDVNNEFERLTGLNKNSILNKKATKVIPKTWQQEFDWIECFGDVALNGTEKEFEQYSDTFNRYFRIKVYSPEKYHFVTIFRDISMEMEIASSSKQLLDMNKNQIDYQTVTENLLEISDAKYVAFNLFQKNGKKCRTVASSGINPLVNENLHLPGFTRVGKEWKYNSYINKKTTGRTTTYFENLKEFADGCISEKLVQQIENKYSTGSLFIIRILNSSNKIGDFTLLMSKEQNLKNNKLIELYVHQVGLFLEKLKAEKKNQHSSRTLDNMLDGISHVVAIQKPDHSIIRYNKAGYELLGKSPEQVKDKKCYQLLGRDRECAKCPTKKVLNSKESATTEKYVPEMEKSLRVTSTPIFKDDGKIKYIIEQLQDITKRKEAEKKSPIQ